MSIQITNLSHQTDVSITPVPKEKYDKRFQTFLELLETESNYVSILDTVVNVSF